MGNPLRLEAHGVDFQEATYQPKVDVIHQTIVNRTGAGGEFLGWLDIPQLMDEAMIQRLEATAKRLNDACDIIVSIGIGGSYLGNIMGERFLSSPLATSKLRYAGQHISSDAMYDLLEELKGKRFGIIVISKSGTTTEPAIAFRLLLNLLKQQDKDYAKHVVAITDANKGALKTFAVNEGFEQYVIPDDVGGRYSVLTPVGLLTFAVLGFDLRALLHGAKQAKADFATSSLQSNLAYRYAALRHQLYQGLGKKVELLVTFEPTLTMFGEWWKQLFGESEGKDLKGLFPASVTYSTDLHSMGQYVQEGERHLFETVIFLKESRNNVVVPMMDSDLDELNYLAGKNLQEINKNAMLGTMQAHLDGDVPQIVLELGKRDEFHLGYLVFMMELSCAMSGYLIGVNPFDQPGVEHYKRNMFALLGKPKK
jgi:glucose-6-phosphate isomerase